jgi:hypothetical protein
MQPFHWKSRYVLCGRTGSDNKHSKRRNVSEVQTVNVDSSLRKMCIELKEYLVLYVFGRLKSCSDAQAEDAIYHRKCFEH